MTRGSESRRLRLWAVALCCAVLSGCITDLDGLRPDETDARLTKAGDNAAKRGDLATAAALYQQAHAAKPSETVALKSLASTLYKLESFRESADSWRAAIALNAEDADAWTGLGRSELALARIGEAKSAFSKSLAVRPNDARTLMSAGVALDLSGEHSEAQSRYREALALSPGDLATQNNLALSYAFAGDLGQAMTLLQQITNRADAGPRNRANYALVLILDNQLDAAESVLLADNVKEEVDRWIRAFEALLPLTGADLARAVFNLDRNIGTPPA